MTVLDAIDSDPVPRVIIAATAVAMCRGGLVECVELARHLKLALCAFADRAPPSDLSEAAEAACDLVDAVRDGNVPVFDHRRDRLGRALARYWAARARDPTVGGWRHLVTHRVRGAERRTGTQSPASAT